MKKKIFSREYLLNSNAILLYLAFFKFLIHLLTNLSGGYGYFRDELYYITCSDNLSFGYVDQPPLSIFLLWVSRTIFGDSLTAIRLLPAISGSVMVFLTGVITRELGGKIFAQIVAALLVIMTPIYLGLNTVYSMNCFDLLFWLAAIFTVIRIIKTGENKLWLLLGVIMGFGLLNKISILWLGFGLFAGLLLTPLRKYFLTVWPWLAGIISFIIFMPHIIWQIINSWPTLEFMHNAATMKMVIKSPIDFLIGQIFMMNPAVFPIWLRGLILYFFSDHFRQFRILGWIYVAVFLLLVVSGTSRDYYLAAAYPMLFSAGAISIEQFIVKHSWNWLKPVLCVYVIATDSFLIPLSLPVLDEESYIRYSHAIGMEPEAEEKKEMGKLPQFYADMHGWQEMAETIAAVFYTIPVEDRAKTSIFTWNYGEAGAISFFGKKYDLPEPISSHNNHWLWGPGEWNGELIIIFGGNIQFYREIFERVEQAAVFTCDYCMPYENNKPVYIARNLKIPINDLWQKIKNYD